jgi:hypothetical protein
MRRRVVALARAHICWVLSALALVGCVGDDTNTPLPDAGVTDATTGGEGGTDGGDASTDGGQDAGTCVLFDAAGLSDAEVQAGRAIVTQSKCGRCHGQEMQGNQNGVPSSTAEGGVAYPPDLTPDPVTGLGCWTNEQIARAFLYGIDDQGELLCNPMPRFGEIGDGGISEAGAAAVVAYLRSLPAISTNVPSTGACPVLPPTDAGPDAGIEAGAGDSGPDGAIDGGGDGSVADGGPDGSISDSGPDATATDGGADAADASDGSSDDGAGDAGLDGD